MSLELIVLFALTLALVACSTLAVEVLMKTSEPFSFRETALGIISLSGVAILSIILGSRVFFLFV